MNTLRCTTAIIRRVPDVFVKAVRRDDSQSVVLKRAKEQFTFYANSLQKCGLTVVTVPADERHPDCTFVEDIAVVIGARALVTRPGHVERRDEVGPVAKALKSLRRPLQICEMSSPEACIDGGDVLFTGREILVGLSKRTNEVGITCLEETFPEYPVTSFPVESNLHLKSLATMCGDDQMLIGGDTEAKQTLQKMQSCAKHEYEYIQLDNNSAANVLLVNDFLFVKPPQEIGQNNYDLVRSHTKKKIIDVPFSEFYKVDGCLTCCSLLINMDATSV